MSSDVIFEPLKWRNIEIKNKIFRSSISGRWDNEDGSLTQVRVNWESRFAQGGVGAIISSYVPVLMEGRILPNYGTIGVADFPSIFNQGPRGQQKMELHWDGNNPSLQERNLSAALGAGVTEQSVDHASIDRVADWLQNLHPPASPYRPDAKQVEGGRQIYMAQCVSCHGSQGSDGYVFEGTALGKVEPNSKLGADKSRLDSYTEKLRDYQLTLFKDVDGGKYQFRYFKKTDGYANLPLDGLWLRAPYLHNGSVPTLADLLSPVDQRPKAFVRGSDVLDPKKGGFEAPPCTPGEKLAIGYCVDTSVRGNGNGGHEYGVERQSSSLGLSSDVLM